MTALIGIKVNHTCCSASLNIYLQPRRAYQTYVLFCTGISERLISQLVLLSNCKPHTEISLEAWRQNNVEYRKEQMGNRFHWTLKHNKLTRKENVAQAWLKCNRLNEISVSGIFFFQVLFENNRRLKILSHNIFKFIFLLMDNCFTEFSCFLSNLNMNQP